MIGAGNATLAVDASDDFDFRLNAIQKFGISATSLEVYDQQIFWNTTGFDHTISATNAFLGIMHGNAVVEFVHGTCGAAPHTWRILTMIAKGWGIMESNIGKSSNCLGYFV